MPTYKSEDYDNYNDPPAEDGISAEQALERSGYDSLEEVQREVLFGSARGIPACCTCGAVVEPDGHCPHGNPSILLKKD